MTNSCVICEEKVKSGDAVHEFPLKSSQEVLEKWKKASGKPKSWRPTKYSRICGKHFLPEDYTVGPLYGENSINYILDQIVLKLDKTVVNIIIYICAKFHENRK
jgi:THAP domain